MHQGPDARNARVPGVFHAMRFWSESRAYPGPDIPPAAYARGLEFSRTSIARPFEERFGRVDGSSRTAAGLAGQGWTPIGPTNGGGRPLTIAFDPANPDIVYAGSATGGLWKSTSGGVGPAAWERVETGFPVMGVSSIAFAPGGVMYLGTGEVYHHGRAGDLAADRATRGSYGIGILRSADGGATWSKSLDWTYEQQHGVWAVRVHPAHPNLVWAATTDGVYRSTNAGTTWLKVLPVLMAMDLVLHPGDPDLALAACGNLSSPGRGIYRTTDGGATWSAITGGGVPADFAGKIQFGVTPADPDLVYASVGNGFEVEGPDNATWLLRSADFGATWSLRGTTDYSRWQGWYAHDVAVHPLHPDTVVCVGIDVWRSTDGGASLAQQSDFRQFLGGDLPPGGPEGTAAYSHADHHDVVYHPTNPDILYLANDGGVFRSLDGGQSFEGVNGGYQTGQFYNGSVSDPGNPDLVMGGLQDFASALYRGNGQWARWILGGDGGWCAVDPTKPDTLYATAQFLFVGKSTNGGATFANISPYPNLGGPVAFIAPFIMSPTNPRVLYAGSSYLFKSFNGGGLWYIGKQGHPIDGNPILLLATARENDAVLYLATAPWVGRGRVHRSLNGGSTYTDITGTLPDRYPGDLAVDPTDEATLYLTLSGFGTSHVFKSMDHGNTWSDLDGGRLPDVPTTAVVVDPLYPNHVYVGNDIGVYVTRDGGATWERLATGLPEAVLIGDLAISPTNRKLRALTHGLGAWEHDLLEPLVAVIPPSATEGRHATLRPAAPNPFRHLTTFQFDVASEGPVSLAVFDVRGAQVRTLAAGSCPAGSHRVSWDGRDARGRMVPEGAYFIRLTTGSSVVTRSVMRAR